MTQTALLGGAAPAAPGPACSLPLPSGQDVLCQEDKHRDLHRDLQGAAVAERECNGKDSGKDDDSGKKRIRNTRK